jgi:O-antigen/teichoic acid export membrane protein
LDFRALEIRQMAGTAAGAVVGISLALLGFGPWAIIGQQLAITMVSTALLWAFASWRPRFVFNFASLRSFAGYSGNVLGTRILFFANRNADNLLIGKFVGSAALGIYSVAYNVMLVPFSQIASPIQEVLFPALSRMQHDAARMAKSWLRANRVVAAISIPSLVGMMVVAPDFVQVVLGDKWHEAAPVIQILAWVGLLQSVQRLNSSVLQARNRTGPLFRYSIVVLAASLIAFVVGLRWGIVGIAVGYAISSTIVEPYYTWLTTQALEISLLTFLRSLRGILEATIAMAAVLIPTRMLLLDHSIQALPRLLILMILGAAVYLPLCAWREGELVGELRQVLERRRASRIPAVASADAA